jgi:hypothetical protein
MGENCVSPGAVEHGQNHLRPTANHRKRIGPTNGCLALQLIHDLANMSVFVRVDQSIKPEVGDIHLQAVWFSSANKMTPVRRYLCDPYFAVRHVINRSLLKEVCTGRFIHSPVSGIFCCGATCVVRKWKQVLRRGKCHSETEWPCHICSQSRFEPPAAPDGWPMESAQWIGLLYMEPITDEERRRDASFGLHTLTTVFLLSHGLSSR